ncbi:MAG TPA: xanthine dehydrogenase family protein subunit M [Mycobacteriales bacterium]|nr:xanthine dehydrogenase family protein subunit M [Mycobacteriales bacterium]
MAVLSFREPDSVDEACALLAADPDNTRIISGGTATVIMIRQRLIAPEHLVSVRDIPALRGITRTAGVLRIGAAVTLREIAEASQVRTIAPSLATACGQVGNPRIRNVATLGGNLAEADYASDPPSALVSLGATCHLAGPAGERELPAGRLITGHYETALAPGELITHVDVPDPPGGRHAVYLKYRSRSSEDRACVGVAARVDVEPGGGRPGSRVRAVDVVVAAVAATPQRVPAVLRAETGNRLDGALADRVARGYARAIDPIDDARGSSGYRRRMIEVFVRRALSAVAELTERTERTAPSGPDGATPAGGSPHD